MFEMRWKEKVAASGSCCMFLIACSRVICETVENHGTARTAPAGRGEIGVVVSQS